jgi:hypothetical protein
LASKKLPAGFILVALDRLSSSQEYNAISSIFDSKRHNVRAEGQESDSLLSPTPTVQLSPTLLILASGAAMMQPSPYLWNTARMPDNVNGNVHISSPLANFFYLSIDGAGY